MTDRQLATHMEDLIRRLMRVLGAQPSHATDPAASSNAARLVYDRLRRTGGGAQWHEFDGAPPLVTAGVGSSLLICYLDDADPSSMRHPGTPPIFKNKTVTAPGINRKAGVVAAMTRYLMDGGHESGWTLVIETDRYRGSGALAAWLEQTEAVIESGIWEAPDIPLPKPSVVQRSGGRLTIKLTVSLSHGRAESLYGGVFPDVGSQLSRSISNLLSPDHEVTLPAFYDEIRGLDEAGIDTVGEVADGIRTWLAQSVSDVLPLPDRQLAMGIFLTPALTIREMHVDDRSPYLSTEASAVVDVRLVPGQSPDKLQAALTAHFQESFPEATIDRLAIRHPSSSHIDAAHLRSEFDLVLPMIPGESPASHLQMRNIPTIGYTAIGRGSERDSASVTLRQIADGAEHIRQLSTLMSPRLATKA